MTIRKGQPWGSARPVPAEVVEITADADLADVVADAWRRGRPVPAVALLGGDLYRTMGGTGDRRRLERGEALAFPLDVGVVVADDGEEEVFAAHVVARRIGWSGPFVVAMNAAWLGSWYLGPRAHPNDGLLDLTRGTLPPVQRALARRRLPTGTHLPHPALRTSRSAHHEVELARSTPVRLDGRRRRPARRLRISCRPDAVEVWV